MRALTHHVDQQGNGKEGSSSARQAERDTDDNATQKLQNRFHLI